MTSAPPSGAASTVIEPAEVGTRLRLKQSGAVKGCFDGAWRPLSLDPVTEFSALVAALSRRSGPVDRIGFNPAAWGLAPAHLAHGPDLVRLSGFFGLQQHTVVVIGPRIRHLTLLVIPPETGDAAAERALAAASASDSFGTAEEILHGCGVLLPDRRSAES
ncbi:hypothetical protein ATK30_7075 [Amycolatopsis echigonensis]|uniref:Uncharacterized protein n=1 Tax=Amycolatopsis echigonensis TaxID=2576905 RepID=A0A2N3WQJ3_9PSEU|nr:DUF5994 family protein [Amycolatopsis niigatensis]PKV96138.1 hypothetical protein ATK30_7075 [Amycolatopsis niigatensis]